VRKWGAVISGFYAVIVLVILYPAAVFMCGASARGGWPAFLKAVREGLAEELVWIIVIMLLASQALLLFLSVDRTQKRLKPRTNIWISCAVGGALTALLVCGLFFSAGVGISGDKFLDRVDVLISTTGSTLMTLGLLWVIWGIIFCVYFRNKTDVVNRLISWLLKGSVLELLVAVPCHVIVRRKDQCCAPIVTSFGIVTGIAIMLLSFGPSVLFLYKKRLDGYRVREKSKVES
jgi:hypothetical protein